MSWSSSWKRQTESDTVRTLRIRLAPIHLFLAKSAS
jgi:hypothetical protein